MSLRLGTELVARIRRHAAEAYPHECCGALLGLDDHQGREVRELVPLENRRDDSPHNRYVITPQDVKDAETEARRTGLELVGWFHSHPDHPSRPSEFDREHAWPWYSYVIVSVDRGFAGEMNSWRLADDRSGFVREEIATAASRAVQVGN